MKTILLVEDADYKANAIRRVLSKAGVEVVRASSLHQAMHALREESTNQYIGAVIIDWTFPYHGDGEPRKGAGSRVVTECQERNLPFVVVSGDDPQDDIKPWITFKPEVALDALKAWVEETKKTVPELVC